MNYLVYYLYLLFQIPNLKSPRILKIWLLLNSIINQTQFTFTIIYICTNSLNSWKKINVHTKQSHILYSNLILVTICV